jgi:hypothetical protein
LKEVAAITVAGFGKTNSPIGSLADARRSRADNGRISKKPAPAGKLAQAKRLANKKYGIVR